LEDIENDFLQNVLSKSIIKNVSENFKHILTHQRIEAKFWHLVLNDEVSIPENYHFYSLDEIESLPKPILIEKYFKGLNFLP
jgi:A/G-specific adenine glycosylase